jgi:hydrogenase-1 operon protein HyaE
MTMTLIDRLVESAGVATVDEDNVDAFVETVPAAVLFFYGNPRQHPESNDVAVILPELIKVFGGRLAMAVVEREAQPSLQQRYGFMQWPALVFVRRDGYLGTITRVRNWAEYLEQIDQILNARPSRPPLAVAVDGGDRGCQGTVQETGE